jgi:hypothetical protein
MNNEPKVLPKFPNMEKLYAVEFIHYTNCMKDVVHSEELDIYLKIVGGGTFIVPEKYLDYFKKFGDGYKSINLVGYTPNVLITDLDTKDGDEDGTE